MRQREDKGSSLRFDARAAPGQRQELEAQTANERLRKSLERGREALVAAKARATREAEKQRRAQEQNQRLDRGPRLGR